MTEQIRFAVQIIERLEQAGIPYMITGSLSSGVYGEARSTNDIDIIIAPTPAQLDAFVASADPKWYVSAEMARDALSDRGMFNVIDPFSGWKTDLIIRKDSPFNVQAFDRRVQVDFMDRKVYMVTPEDAILTKLEWARKTKSERQLRDVAGILRVSGDRLDRDYLARWARELGVSDLLQKVLLGVGPQ